MCSRLESRHCGMVPFFTHPLYIPMRFSLSTCLIQSFLDPDASTQASLDDYTLVLNTLGYWLLQTIGSSPLPFIYPYLKPHKNR